MLKKAAQVFSVIFHPLLLPTYAMALTLFVNPFVFSNYDQAQQGRFVMIVFINTFLFPALSVFLILKLKLIKTPQMQGRQERILPFVAAGGFYIWCFMTFFKTGLPRILSVSLLGACITLFTTFFINIFRKISLHTAGMGSFLALCIVLSLFSFYDLSLIVFAVIIIAGITGSIRLYLEAHNNAEIYSGYFVGFICQLIAFKFLMT